MSSLAANSYVPAGAIGSKIAGTVITLNYTWTIGNFNFFLLEEVVESPMFSSETYDGTRWSLKLYPKGKDGAREDQISVSLNLHPCSKKEALANFKILLLGANGEQVEQGACYEPHAFKPGTDGGFVAYIDRKLVFKNRDTYLPNYNLTIQCEMSYTVDGQRVSELPSTRNREPRATSSCGTSGSPLFAPRAPPQPSILRRKLRHTFLWWTLKNPLKDNDRRAPT